jgi:hypothetical protein
MGGVGGGYVFWCESCQMRVNEIEKFVAHRGSRVVDVKCGVHGMKRGGGRSVREEDRHHRQVLLAVELKLVLFHRVANSNGAVTRTRK